MFIGQSAGNQMFYPNLQLMPIVFNIPSKRSGRVSHLLEDPYLPYGEFRPSKLNGPIVSNCSMLIPIFAASILQKVGSPSLSLPSQSFRSILHLHPPDMAMEGLEGPCETADFHSFQKIFPQFTKTVCDLKVHKFFLLGGICGAQQHISSWSVNGRDLFNGLSRRENPQKNGKIELVSLDFISRSNDPMIDPMIQPIQ